MGSVSAHPDVATWRSFPIKFRFLLTYMRIHVGDLDSIMKQVFYPGHGFDSSMVKYISKVTSG